MPHGYTNATVDGRSSRWSSATSDRTQPRAAERGRGPDRPAPAELPVPAHPRPGRAVEITSGWSPDDPGRSGWRPHPEQVLYAVGQHARRLADRRRRRGCRAGPRPRPATVLVHGDFGPQNLLLDQRAPPSRPPCVDWELAHIGDPVDRPGLGGVDRPHPPPAPGAVRCLPCSPGYRNRPPVVRRQARRCSTSADGAPGLRPPLARRATAAGSARSGSDVTGRPPAAFTADGTGPVIHRQHLERDRPVDSRCGSARASSGLRAPEATSARIWSRVSRGSGSGSSASPSLRSRSANREPGRRVGDPEVLLDLAQVAARGQEHPQHVGLGRGQCAELARGEDPGQLAAAGGTAEPGHRQVLAAHRAVARGPVLVALRGARRDRVTPRQPRPC